MVSNLYDMVTIGGKVVEQVDGEEAEAHVDRLAKIYMDKDKYPGRASGDQNKARACVSYETMKCIVPKKK